MYLNAKDMIDNVRDDVGESSAAHWSDLQILRRLNMAQSEAAKLVSQSKGQWLVKSKNLTPSDSVITLPSDCEKPIYMEETSSGKPINWLGSVAKRRISRLAGSTFDIELRREAYPLLDTIEVNEDSYSTQVTLWYQIKVPNLHAGTAQSGSGASAIEFDDNTTTGTGRGLVFLDDYYNNSIIEIIDQTSGIVSIRSEISDYVASTHVATITGTAASGDTYGTISRLPELCNEFILARTTHLCLSKPSSTIDENVLRMVSNNYRDAKSDMLQHLSNRIIENTGVAIGEPYI